MSILKRKLFWKKLVKILNKMKYHTWHIMQASDSWSSDGNSSKLRTMGFGVYSFVFSRAAIVSSDKLVLTLPIFSPSARSSYNQQLKYKHILFCV